MALKETQKYFYALNLDHDSFSPNTDDSLNLLKLRIKEAEKDGPLKYLASTYDFQNGILRDGTLYEGKKLVTFANILKHETFPFAKILEDILDTGQREMAKPIEIEFAVELNRKKGDPVLFNVLQIRPIVDNNQTIVRDLSEVSCDQTIIYSKSALGNGVIKDICDFVYIKPESFDAAKNSDIANDLGGLNEKFIEEQRNYVLVGPGRWGSSDPWLGIPVKWPQISAARVIVESGLSDYRIDPSQGTHFFRI